ncbi:MAG: polyprenyl synthetase family protein [Halobacteriota archaeon]
MEAHSEMMVSDYSDFFSDMMDEYRVTVDNAISNELRRLEDSPFFEPLSYALTGGKRLRPILLLLAFQSTRGLARDPLPPAVAVEIIHSGSLAIDDIIDEDLTRRDIEAFHKSYGLKISLLNTEMLLSIMLDIVGRCLDHRVAQVLAQAVSNLGTGAFEELTVYTAKQTIDMDEYLSILYKKTGFLFEASARIGALVAGAQENEVDALSDYGRLIGLAYQMQDDIVDRKEKPMDSLATYLDDKFRDGQHLEALSASYVAEAKERLKELEPSEAKHLLMTLADIIGTRAATKLEKAS